MKPNLIRSVTRTAKRKFIVQAHDSESEQRVKVAFSNTNVSDEVSFTALTPRSPDGYKRARGLNSEDGRTYVEFLSTSSGNVFIEETPIKQSISASEVCSSSELRFENMPSIVELRKNNPDAFDSVKTEPFDFKVTKEDIESRIGVKRNKTQQQAFGCSAKDVFEAIGMHITSSFGQRQYHLAHRQAWFLGGEQVKGNLDPATAGSNYSTLANVESPLKNLLESESIDNMHVFGEVKYHPLLPVPMEITYTLSWGNGRTFQAKIHPLEPRTPVFSEHIVANAMLGTARTPEKAEKQSSLRFFKVTSPVKLNGNHSPQFALQANCGDEMSNRPSTELR